MHRGTRIEGDELFKFEKAAEPLVNVLCQKLLEQSRMEVLEEEELSCMREQQQHYERLRQQAKQETEALEKAERQRQQEIVRLVSVIDRRSNVCWHKGQLRIARSARIRS